MLTKVRVHSDDPIDLPIIGATPKDSLLVRQITGIEPPDINLFVGDYSRDGGIYTGRRVGTRNIVMTIQLNPNPADGETVSQIRSRLHKSFINPQPEAEYLKLSFHLDDERVLYAVGYVEKFESDIFSQETLVQISLICPDPYFRDDIPTTLTSLSGWTTVPFDYEGTAQVGFGATIHVNTATSRLILANNTVTDNVSDPNYPRGRMILNKSFAPGDMIFINTQSGDRSIYHLPAGGGVSGSAISALDPRSQWLSLHSSSNSMKVYGATPLEQVATIRQLSFVQAYWGL